MDIYLWIGIPLGVVSMAIIIGIWITRPSAPLKPIVIKEGYNPLSHQMTIFSDQQKHSPLAYDGSLESYTPLEVGSVLNSKYRIDSILGSGAQGSVYLCTNLQLGNQWAVKQFSGSMNEKEILVQLNHIYLPKIADVFHNEKGFFMIESYIEGVSLEHYISHTNLVTEAMVIDWMCQICEALAYIHQRHILHMDIKPQNIMITPEQKAVLIDFGISTHAIDGMVQSYRKYGYSPNFCAPEQKDLNQPIDTRSDLYALAATFFYVITGNQYRIRSDINQIKTLVSYEFASILENCLQTDPKMRYGSSDDLLNALKAVHWVQTEKDKIRHRNKALLVAVIPMMIASLSLSGLGIVQHYNELESKITVNMHTIMLSEQEVQLVEVTQIYPNGQTKDLEGDKLKWLSQDVSIARVHNGQIIGVNPGITTVTGYYGNRYFDIHVEVSSGVLGVKVSMQYNTDWQTGIYAGNGVRDIVDGGLDDASFLEPASITIDQQGTVYLADRYIRKIKDGVVTTIHTGRIQPQVLYHNPHTNKIYFVSKPYLDENDHYVVTFFEILPDDSYVILLTVVTDGMYVGDFIFDDSDRMLLLLNDFVYETTQLVRLHLDGGIYEVLIEHDELLYGMAMDQEQTLYLTQPDTGVLYKLDENNDLVFFAGAKYEKHFVDGPLMRFFEPMALTTDGQHLYLVDHNVIRKIIMENGQAISSETLSGVVEPTDEVLFEGEGYLVSYQNGLGLDLALDLNGMIYVADGKNHIIRSIEK